MLSAAVLWWLKIKRFKSNEINLSSNSSLCSAVSLFIFLNRHAWGDCEVKHLSVNLAVWVSALEKPQKYSTWNIVKLCYMALFTCVTCLQLCLRTTFLQSFPKCTVYLVGKNGTRPFLLPASTFVIIKREVRIDVSSHLTHFSGQPEQKLSLWRNGTHTTITTTLRLQFMNLE